ncbi:hypothetical protein, conserved [Eimeria tenella]|uniref:F-box domain-containing protein n=1 Tax=Eimeria tenella TaxID=5802 RepID=U6L1T8_EIMTE|nr:hypothetical protein, conserved [Eimeria tenella]CDJ43158.1 hypothetical protein, conserved [Eimeria tenella]|eukprot:XP_013233908.1 hypothetical protein, conserved [Eimeria tenella]
MSGSDRSSGDCSENSRSGSPDACSVTNNVVSPSPSISNYNRDNRSSCIARSPLSDVPDVLLASILRFLPQNERIKVGSLVCRRWLGLIRSRLCLSDTMIHVSPPVYRQLPSEAIRACIRTIAIHSRHAELVINSVDPMAMENGEFPDLLFLRSLFKELSEIRSISVSVGCPLTARMLGDAFAGVVQRSATTLVSLEIWEAELAEATLTALAATPPPWDTCDEHAKELGDAFLTTAAALESTVGPHVTRRDHCATARQLMSRPQASGGMLLATAQVLRERMQRSTCRSSLNSFESEASGGGQQQQQQQRERQMIDFQESYCRTSEGHLTHQHERSGGCVELSCTSDIWREWRKRTHRSELRCRIAEIENCCCCVSSAEIALRVWRKFEGIRLILPQLKSLVVGSWRLLQLLHCPNLEELNLTSNTATRYQDTPSRLQQERQRQQHQHQQLQQTLLHREQSGYSHLTSALEEWAGRLSGPGGARSAPAPSADAESALQELLHFLLRSGYNIRLLQGSYTVGALNESLLHSVASAGNILTSLSDQAPRAPHIKARLRHLLAATAPPVRAKRGQRHGRRSFVPASLSTADIYDPSSVPQSTVFDPAMTQACGSLSPTATSSLVSGCIAATNASKLAAGTAAVQTASAKASTAHEAVDNVLSAAAGLCAAVGNGCRHVRHLPNECCAVPCAWGSGGELLLVLLPRLRAVRTSDFMLLSCLLLPRLEELRLPETWGSVVSKPIPGFSLLWAYLCTYGRSLRVLDVKGTAPPLAAFLGAGTTREPLPFRMLPYEAVATKALQRVLLVHRAHPLMDPASLFKADRCAGTFPECVSTSAAPTAAVSAGIADLAARTVSDIWRRRSTSVQQQRPQAPSGELSAQIRQNVDFADDLVDLEAHPFRGEEIAWVSHQLVTGQDLDQKDLTCRERDDGSAKPLFGLKFGQLKQLQCHSSFLPYLAEPLPQCGALQSLNTEGDSDSVVWFVALLKNIERLCVRDPCLNLSRRRSRSPPLALETEDEEVLSSKSRPQVTLQIRKYVGTALFFTPNLSCPNLLELQVQRGDDDFDSFLAGGGARNLQVLRYQGRLFGGTGASTPRTLMASQELRIIRSTERSTQDAHKLLQALRLPLNFSPLESSPFACLRELHLWTLDAKVLVRLALATAAAVNPLLSLAWQRVLDSRKAERLQQLQRRKQLSMQRTQTQRNNEAARLLVRQRRLYEEYSARRRRLKRLSAAVSGRQAQIHGTSGGSESCQQREHQETQRRLARELSSMRQELQQLQRRLESLASANFRSSAGSAARQEHLQLQRYHRFRENLQRLRRLRSHHQRLVALRRLLQISVTDALSYPLEPLSGASEFRRVDESEAARRKVRAQRGREADFGCSRNWCFWNCHRAVAALSQLLPQLRSCVVQQLRGNATSLRLLLRGLPRLELFAVEESPKSRLRQRLLQLAGNLGFTVRRGPLVIPALHSNLVNWGSSTISRQFRILSRAPAGRKAAAASVAAAEILVRELLERYARNSSGQSEHTSQARMENATVSSTSSAPSRDTSSSIFRPFPAPCLALLGPVGADRAAARTPAADAPISRSNSEDQQVTALKKRTVPPTEGFPPHVEPGVCLPGLSGRACGRTGSDYGTVFRSLRCRIYSNKCSRDSRSSAVTEPAPKRRRRRRRAAETPTEVLHQDMQMLRGLAEDLEEQLTS